MKTIHIRYSPQEDIIGLDVSEGIKLGDIVEIKCKDKTFLVCVVQWDNIENNCTKCVLGNSRCLDGYRGICSRIISRKRACFQELCYMMEDI